MKDKDFLYSKDVPFEFLDDGKQHIDDKVGIKKVSSEYFETGDIKVIKTVFSADNIVKSAVRYEFYCRENTLFIADRVLSDGLNIGVRTRFFVAHNDIFNCNVAAKSKLVLRKDGIGKKFFRLACTLDGESIIEKAGLLLPDGTSAASLGLTFYSGLYRFGREHTSIYGICTDADSNMGKWHFLEDNGFLAQPPTHEGGYKISQNENSVTVENTANPSETVTFDF